MVFIEWLDSKIAPNLWVFAGEEEKESLKPSSCISMGFVLSESDEYIAIVQSISGDTILGGLAIPKCSIKKLTDLKEQMPQIALDKK